MTSPDLDKELREHAQRWATRQPDPPPMPTFGSAGPAARRVRSLAIAATVILVAALAIAIPVSRHQDTSNHQPVSSSPDLAPSIVSDAVRARLVQIAMNNARAQKGTNVTAQAVKSHLHSAESLLNPGSVDGAPNEPVWVIAMRGSFTCAACPGAPGGANAIHGGYLTVILRTRDYSVAGLQLGGKFRNLALLGPVFPLIGTPNATDPISPRPSSPGALSSATSQAPNKLPAIAGDVSTVTLTIGDRRWTMGASRTIRIGLHAGQALPIRVAYATPSGTDVSNIWLAISNHAAGLALSGPGGSPLQPALILIHHPDVLNSGSELRTQWVVKPLFGTRLLNLTATRAVGHAGVQTVLAQIRVIP